LRDRMYSVYVTQAVKKTLKKLNKRDQKRIGDAINSLVINPRPNGVCKLAGESSLYRIRVGDYRIIYDIQDKKLIVLVVRIGLRGDIYKEFWKL